MTNSRAVTLRRAHTFASRRGRGGRDWKFEIVIACPPIKNVKSALTIPTPKIDAIDKFWL